MSIGKVTCLSSCFATAWRGSQESCWATAWWGSEITHLNSCFAQLRGGGSLDENITSGWEYSTWELLCNCGDVEEL